MTPLPARRSGGELALSFRVQSTDCGVNTATKRLGPKFEVDADILPRWWVHPNGRSLPSAPCAGVQQSLPAHAIGEA
jgi:hypothetical protein